MVSIHDLVKLARDNTSEGFGGKAKNAHMAAVILDHKGNAVSFGFNKCKSHPLQKKFSKNEHAIFLHAEIDAIINAIRAGVDVSGMKMLIARSLKDGTPANAKPCVGCQKALVHFNLSDVVWTS